jgi:hypothetical protein
MLIPDIARIGKALLNGDDRNDKKPNQKQHQHQEQSTDNCDQNTVQITNQNIMNYVASLASDVQTVSPLCLFQIVSPLRMI